MLKQPGIKTMLIESQTHNVHIKAECENLFLMTTAEFMPVADLLRGGRWATVMGTLCNGDVMNIIQAYTEADSSRMVTHSAGYQFYREIKIGGDAPAINMAQLTYIKKLPDVKHGDMIIVTMKPGHFALFEMLD